MDKGTFNKAVNAIGSQDMNLKERLERRKRQSSIQAVRRFNKKVESDVSGGNENVEREKKLEELLEKNFTEKAEELSKIKSMYNEKKKSHAEKTLIFEQECDAEIKIKSDIFDQKRKNELQKFKDEYQYK